MTSFMTALAEKTKTDTTETRKPLGHLGYHYSFSDLRRRFGIPATHLVFGRGRREGVVWVR